MDELEALKDKAGKALSVVGTAGINEGAISNWRGERVQQACLILCGELGI